MLSASLAGLLLLDACTSWRVQAVSPAELVIDRRPVEVRVRAQDGNRTVLRQPFVRGDSLLGSTRRDTTGFGVDEVHAIEVRRFDWLKTAGLVVLTAGVIMSLACAMACGSFETGF